LVIVEADRSRVTFWYRWLVAVTVGMMAFGLAMVIAPGLTRQGFSLMVYSSADRIGAFGEEPAAYVELAHAVMGSVMFGWGTALLLVLRGPFRRAVREGWTILAVSLVAWFVPDTLFSLRSGFWQNAVLNSVFAVLYAIPLAAIYRQARAPQEKAGAD
jgi:hypothetical protein